MKLTYKEVLEANVALLELNKLKLPIRSCVQLARLSNLVDTELQVFTKTRDSLVKEYQINPQHTEDEGVLNLATFADVGNMDKEKLLREFVDKFNELLNIETADWDIKIPLPDNIFFTPKLLKPVEAFIEVVSAP